MPILTRALRDRRVALFWWTLGVIVYCGFIIAVWPVIDGNEELEDLYQDMPEALQAMFGADGFAGLTTPTGFLNAYLYSMILPFIFTGLAISFGASLLAGEEEDGLLDLVLSYPVRRRRVVLEKAAAIVIALIVIGAATVVLLVVAKEPADLDVGVAGLLAATLGSALFALVGGFVALFVGTVRGDKGLATGLGWGVAVAGYLLNIVANLADSLDWLAPLSPLHWATAVVPVAVGAPGTYVALVVAAAVLLVAAVATFERHDLS